MLKLQTFIVFFAVACITLLIAGCAREPNPVGAKLLPGGDYVKLDTATFDLTRCYNLNNITATSGSPRVLVGGADGLQSWGIFRFSYLPDSLRTMRFASAALILRTVYHYGDSLAPFSFSVHRILQNWQSDSLTIDSLQAPGFYQASSCGQWNEAVGDTVSISVALDTTAVRKMGTASDSVITNFGLLLRPTNSKVIKGFGSFSISDASLSPQLMLRMLDAAGNVDTLIVKLGVHRYVVSGINPSWPADSSRLYVMNGGSSRGYVEFDVKSLPLHAAIHKALLTLTPEPALSKLNYFTVDSLQAFFTTDDGVTYPYLSAEGGPVLSGTNRVYQFHVGVFVQQWARGAKTQRIAIAGLTESSSIDLFAFHGASSDRTLRPKLTVIYSIIR